MEDESLKVAEFWRRAIAGVEKAFHAYKTQAHTYAHTGTALWGITGRETARYRHSNRVKETVGECEWCHGQPLSAEREGESLF